MLTLSKSTSHGCGLPLCLSALFRCREIITYTTVLKLKRILCELCECEHLHMLCIALLLLSILMLSNPSSFSVPFSCYRSCCACKCECSNVCVCERECFNVCVRSCLVLESNAICPGILLSFLFHLLFDWIFFFVRLIRKPVSYYTSHWDPSLGKHIQKYSKPKWNIHPIHI